MLGEASPPLTLDLRSLDSWFETLLWQQLEVELLQRYSRMFLQAGNDALALQYQARTALGGTSAIYKQQAAAADGFLERSGAPAGLLCPVGCLLACGALPAAATDADAPCRRLTSAWKEAQFLSLAFKLCRAKASAHVYPIEVPSCCDGRQMRCKDPPPDRFALGLGGRICDARYG